MAAPARRTERTAVVQQGLLGAPWPAWYGECNVNEVSQGGRRLWCGWHNEGEGAFLARHEAFSSQQRGSTDRRSCVACATRRRAATHSDAPSLQQCHDMMPHLSNRRQSAWRLKNFDGAAAALLVRSWHAQGERSDSDDDEVRDGARIGSFLALPQTLTRPLTTLTLTLTLALALTLAPALALALALAPVLNRNQDVARRQLGTDLRTCKLRLATLERNTPSASLQAPLARQGALERWRSACAAAPTAALLTAKLVEFIDSLDEALASRHLVEAATQARLALRPAAGSSSAARSDEAAATSLLKDTLGTLTHAG